MVHILLVNHFQTIQNPVEMQNLTFAAPLYGNLGLKSFLSSPQEDKRFYKMHHFVNVTDIIPASMLIPYVYNSIPWYGRGLARMASWFDWSSVKAIENFLKEVKAQAKTEHQK